jgi:predicted NBD/HSP70 family sugar kinase
VSELVVGRLRSVGGASGHDAREVNRRSALHAIASGAAVTRAEIARATGLTRPTVSSLVAELVDEGIVVEVGPGSSAGGKRPTLLAIDPTARQVVAVDASSRPIRGRLVDLGGAILAEGSMPPAAGDAAVDAVATLISDLAGRATAPLVGVGVGTAGLTTEDGVVVEAANLDWHDLPLRDLLQDRTGLPVVVANDADAAVLVELGSLPPDRHDLALVQVSAGIGAGIVVGGRRLVGGRAAAGEIGHLVIDAEGSPCSCGNRGCLETVASVPNLIRLAGGDPAAPPPDLATLVATDPLRAEAAIAVAAAGLGSVLAHLVAILDVPDLVLWVDLPGAGAELAPRVEREVRGRLLSRVGAEVSVRCSDAEELVLDGAHALVLAAVLGMVRP